MMFFTFNGENSAEYGVYISGEATYDTPDRIVETVQVAGRNGELIVDDANYSNDYDENLDEEQKVLLLQEWMKDNPYKTTYVHLADIRCTDIEESGYNRSFYINQFVRGCAVAVQTGKRGVPVSQGGKDVMSWEEIIEELK